MPNASKIMNGTWGQLWKAGVLRSECTAFQVKITKNFEDKNLCGQMATDRKLISVKISGSITFDKVYTVGADDAKDAMAGIDDRETLVGNLNDPDAYGAERIAVYGVSYDEQTLADWAAAKAGSITLPFQATSFTYLDKVEA